MFRGWNDDIINMSTVPEAVLAREAGLCYAAVAMSTDYDCWRETGESVSWEAILTVFKKNAANVIELFKNVIPKVQHTDCECMTAIKTAVMN